MHTFVTISQILTDFQNVRPDSQRHVIPSSVQIILFLLTYLLIYLLAYLLLYIIAIAIVMMDDEDEVMMLISRGWHGYV